MEVTILDRDLVKIKLLDVFDSLVWIDRYGSYGDFELYNKASTELFEYLREDYYIQLKQSEHLMLIESINLTTDVEEGDKFIATGRSIESILDRRIIWKQTVLSGGFQDGIKRLLDENVISPEDPDRKISRIIFEESTDEHITSLTIDDQYYGDNLYEVIEKLCFANGIGFKMTLSENKMFVFKLYSGVDRSYSQIANSFVAFSPDLDNLTNTNYFHSKQTLKTATLIGGEGEGSDQKITELVIGDGIIDMDRREIYTDATDVSSLVDGVTMTLEEYLGLLVKRGLINLLENQAISAFDGKIDPNINYVYGTDCFIGDILQTQNEYGLSGRSRVIGVMFSEDLSGTNVYPDFLVID